MKPLSILHMVDGMDPKQGGVCQAVRMMIGGLNELGVVNEVVCQENPEAPYLRVDKLQVHALGKGKGPWSYNAALRPWLASHLPRFDVVVLHGLWLYQGYAVREVQKALCKQKEGTALCEAAQVRLFVMPHGMLDPYFQRATSRWLKALRNRIYWKIVESKVVNEASGMLFTTEEECQLAQSTFSPYAPKREYTVGLGVEEPPAFRAAMAESFQQKCPGLNRTPFLLYLGRIHEKKGVDLLIEAYENVIRNIPALVNNVASTGGVSGAEKVMPANSNLLPKLVIAGPGMDSYYGMKAKGAVQNSPILKENVFFPGMLSGDAKWGAFYTCEAFVLPSHQENFGVAVVEALGSAKPVLISDKVNIWREVVTMGAGIAEADTHKGVGTLLVKWLAMSSEEKVTMGKNARSCFERNFAVAPAAAKLLDAVTDN